MKAIFNQTVKRMFRLKNVLIYYLIIIVPSFIVGFTIRFSRGVASLAEVQATANAVLMLMVFLWLTGIPFIVNIVGHGMNLFASEEAEGTMGLLVIKPISRNEIVLGKMLGLMAGTFIYQITSVFLSYFVFYLSSWIDSGTIGMFFSYLPGIFLYSLFVTFFFTALSSAMSIIFKKKIAGIIISLLIIFAAFGIFPIVRSIIGITGSYEKAYVYLYDINYHFGLIFHTIISIFNKGMLTSSIMQVVGSFTGTYVYGNLDRDITAFTSNYRNSLSVAEYINPIVLTLIYLIIAAGLFWFVFFRMQKKDIS